jgi:hypothetical protein
MQWIGESTAANNYVEPEPKDRSSNALNRLYFQGQSYVVYIEFEQRGLGFRILGFLWHFYPLESDSHEGSPGLRAGMACRFS